MSEGIPSTPGTATAASMLASARGILAALRPGLPQYPFFPPPSVPLFLNTQRFLTFVMAEPAAVLTFGVVTRQGRQVCLSSSCGKILQCQKGY